MRGLPHLLSSPVRFRVLLAFIGSLWICPLVWAQASGVISGTVTDAHNRPLPGVRVMLTSPDDLQRHSTVTDAKGRYEVVKLTTGTYTVTAELPGFSSEMKRQRVTGARREVWLVMEATELPETLPAPARPSVRIVPLSVQR